MIRLHLLGSVRLLDGDGRDIRAVLQQPKRLALLAFLAAARPRGAHRRDTLTGMFWGEADAASARKSLSQALYFLRQHVHPDLFAGRFAEEVGLKAGELWCDVVAFEEALDAGRTAEALALYNGELMPGFHISEAPEWEKWLDGERDRLRTRAAEAAWSLAAAEEQAGNAGAAAHWARWAAGLHPYDEQQHRRVLELLVRTGDRAGALRTHEEFARRLATEFEVEPSPETLALVEAIRRDAGSGEQDELIERAALGLVRRAEASAGAHTGQPGGAVAVPPTVEGAADTPGAATRAVYRSTARRRRPLSASRATILVAAVIAAISLLYLATRPRSGSVRTVAVAPEQPLNRIAIRPFRDLSEDGRLAHIAEGLALTLTDRLAEVEQLSVISPNTTRQFGEVTHDSLGRALNAGTIVDGSVTRSGTRLRARIELIDARTGTTLAAQPVEQEQGDLFLLLDSAATHVGWMLREKLGAEIELREFERETESQRAWELVQMARDTRWPVPDLPPASAEAAIALTLRYLDEAIQLDREYIRAWVERSRTFHTAWFRAADPQRQAALLDSMKAAAATAIRIDSTNADALEQRAAVTVFSWNLDQTEENAGLLDRAEADARRALVADPQRPRTEALLSQIHYQKGEFREAYNAALRAYRADAWAERAEEVLIRLFETAFELGNDDEAAKWCDELRRREPGSWSQYHCELTLLAFATSGQPDVRKALLAFQNARRLPHTASFPALEAQLSALVAASYARAGMADSARSITRRALAAAPTDRFVQVYAAATLLRLGDTNDCIQLLGSVLAAGPAQKDRLLRSRLFEPLDPQTRSTLLAATDRR